MNWKNLPRKHLVARLKKEGNLYICRQSFRIVAFTLLSPTKSFESVVPCKASALFNLNWS